jgi:EAL domain-containing protein (putative c-di-GMP-specific phosphodiesterase class I)/GGDEF domain-containing protein
MTLGRLLAYAVSALFVGVIIGVEALNLLNAQTHLQRQLESAAQDAATSLGLTLGAVLREGDSVLAETVINPMFDRGHYQRIEYVDAGGRQAVVKTLPAAQGGYPNWFVALLPLESPTAESLVSAGWRQLGKVRVTVHPRFAYEQLWTSVRDTLIYLIALFLAALLALRLILRGVLRPLLAVEQAAQEISARRYVTLGLRPGTRELARVVDAMNLLSRKVSETIDAEVRRAERLQDLAFQDEVTGLPNARGFVTRFEARFESSELRFRGVLVLVELAGLAALNAQLGGERCNRLLRAVGAAIGAWAAEDGGFAGRWGGARFVAALPGADGDGAGTRLEALRGRVVQVVGEYGVADQDAIYCDAVEAGPRHAGMQALGHAAEEALQQARDHPARTVIVSGADESAGAQIDVTAMVLEALNARRVGLVGQSAFRMSDHRILHTEIFGRLHDADGRAILAAQFIPVIAAQRMSEALDRAVIEAVAARIPAGDSLVSVNLSIRSLGSGTFADWLGSLLTTRPAAARRLVFEVAEHGAIQDEARLLDFARAARSAGSSVALDHFGAHQQSLALMQHLRPAYVKLAASHTGAILADAGARFYAESLVRAARQLDIPVIAQNIEDDDSFRAISAVGFSGYQGNMGGRPAPWPPA